MSLKPTCFNHKNKISPVDFNDKLMCFILANFPIKIKTFLKKQKNPKRKKYKEISKKFRFPQKNSLQQFHFGEIFEKKINFWSISNRIPSFISKINIGFSFHEHYHMCIYNTLKIYTLKFSFWKEQMGKNETQFVNNPFKYANTFSRYKKRRIFCFLRRL